MSEEKVMYDAGEVPANEERLAHEITPVLQRAGDIVVRTQQEYAGAAGYRAQNKAAQKMIKDFFAPMIDQAKKAYDTIRMTRDRYLKPLVARDEMVKGIMEAYQTRIEDEREKERKRLQAELDEKARKQREKLEEQARRAEEAGKLEKAEALRTMAEEAIAPVVEIPVAVPKVDGTVTRRVWKATVTDMAKYLAAAAADVTGMLRAPITVNEAQLARMAHGEVAPVIPGVEFRKVTQVATQARAEE